MEVTTLFKAENEQRTMYVQADGIINCMRALNPFRVNKDECFTIQRMDAWPINFEVLSEDVWLQK